MIELKPWMVEWLTDPDTEEGWANVPESVFKKGRWEDVDLYIATAIESTLATPEPVGYCAPEDVERILHPTCGTPLIGVHFKIDSQLNYTVPLFLKPPASEAAERDHRRVQRIRHMADSIRNVGKKDPYIVDRAREIMVEADAILTSGDER